MKLPCQLIVWNVLPAIRAAIAEELNTMGVSQLEAARLLDRMGAETRIFDPRGLPLPDSVPPDHPKVQELRSLSEWSEGQVWCSTERHGTITVGDTVFTAYDRLEKVEHSAQVSAAARQLGPVKPLPREEIDKLLALREKLGLKSKVYPCNSCGLCASSGGAAHTAHGLVSALSAELYRTLREKL